jgi:hypothetical protein
MIDVACGDRWDCCPFFAASPACSNKD